MKEHTVCLIKDGDFRKTGVDICSGQQRVYDAPVLFIMTAILEGTMWKYENGQALRVIHLDAGYLGQTFLLVCEALQLGLFSTAAINNKLVEEIFQLNPVYQPVIYVCAAGYRVKS